MTASRPPLYAADRLEVQTEPEPDAGSEPDPVPETRHTGTIVESGSFARAVCATCGWSGPARRARAFATTDLDGHS